MPWRVSSFTNIVTLFGALSKALELLPQPALTDHDLIDQNVSFSNDLWGYCRRLSLSRALQYATVGVIGRFRRLSELHRCPEHSTKPLFWRLSAQ